MLDLPLIPLLAIRQVVQLLLQLQNHILKPQVILGLQEHLLIVLLSQLADIILGSELLLLVIRFNHLFKLFKLLLHDLKGLL